MKLKLLAFSSLALFFFSSCQKKDDDSEIVSEKYIHKYGFAVSADEWNARNKNGEVVITLKNGITYTSTYKSGILHGPQTISFPHSKIIQQRLEYDNGTVTKKTIFDISGLPTQEYVFELDGKKIITLWDRKGVPLSMEEYVNDLLLSARYYNSQNEIEGTITDGNGTRIKRNRDGLLLSQETINNGSITYRKTFHPNGELQSQCSFANYQLHVKQETFSPNGKLITSVNWNNGKMDGMMTCFRNNQLVNEIPYTDGKKHGIEKEYNLEGAIVKEIHWDNDKKHGTSRSYFDDYTDIQWYWKGVAVDLKKFQELELHQELMAEIESQKRLIPEEYSNEDHLGDSQTF